MTPSALSNETLDDLLAAAGAATPGRRGYVHDEDSDDYLLVCEPNDTPLGRFDACLDAEFAAECTPTRVTALITELLSYRSEGPVADEEIARIIDPHAFMPIAPENIGDDLIEEIVKQSRDLALSKATRIKSALSPSTERGETIEGWQPIETLEGDGPAWFWLDWADDCAKLNPPLAVDSPERLYYGTRRSWVSVYKATHWRNLDAPKQVIASVVGSPPRALNPSGSVERG